MQHGDAVRDVEGDPAVGDTAAEPATTGAGSERIGVGYDRAALRPEAELEHGLRAKAQAPPGSALQGLAVDRPDLADEFGLLDLTRSRVTDP